MTERKTRAQKGGEEGVNGYWYKGGQFLPNTTLRPTGWKNKKQFSTNKKQQIDNWVYEFPPCDDVRAIYEVISPGTVTKLEHGIIVVCENIVTNSHFNYSDEKIELLQELVSRYNNGELWCEYKNLDNLLMSEEDFAKIRHTLPSREQLKKEVTYHTIKAKYNTKCKVTGQKIIAGVTDIAKIDGKWQVAP